MIGTLYNALAQDVRYALRQMRRSPGFAATAILTIALGIGANTAVFTLVHAILLQRLPVADPASLYRIGSGGECCVDGGTPSNEDFSDMSTEAYLALRDNLPEFTDVAATMAGGDHGPSLAKRAGTSDAALYVRSNYVSGNYFDLFGVHASRGRLILPTDDNESAPPVAVMSYSTWVHQFAADPGVVGTSFLLANHPVTIVGIAPASFYGDRMQERSPDFYLPIADEPAISGVAVAKNPRLRWLYVLGRVRPGVNLSQLQQHINQVLRAYEATQPEYQSAQSALGLPKVHADLVSAATGVQKFQREVGTSLRVLFGVSAMVLLIACANVANLLLARGMARRAEMSIRVALGAARARIVRQTLTESLLLALLGAAGGIALAFAGARGILALAFAEARNLPITATPSIPVLLFTLAVAVLTGVLFGVVPTWVATAAQPVDALRGRSQNTGNASPLPQRALVVLQAALSLLLITVAALLTRSLINLQHQNFGLDTEDRVVVHMDPAASGYTLDRMEGLMQRLSERIHALPGTVQVGFANYSPLEGNNWGDGVFIEGRPDPTRNDDVNASWDRVSPGFFQAIGQPLLRGRDFATTDRKGTPGVAIVNQAFARKFFSAEDPIGKRFGSEPHRFDYTIVGIVGDAKYIDVAGPAVPMFFRPELQPKPTVDPKDMEEIESLTPHTLVVHTAGAAPNYDAELRRAFQEVDPNLAIIDLRSLNAQVAGQLTQERTLARLTATFGVLALVLASIGLYGVTAYTVAQRVPEIGVRMALGSDRAAVVALVLRGALTQLLLGLVLGIPAALLAGRALQSQLYGVSGHDVATLAGACGALALSALAASAIPARRASNIDPMRALRAE